MLIILSILSVAGVGAAIAFGLSLKKYQKLYFEAQVEGRKQGDDYKQKIEDKEKLLEEHQHQLSDLEKKVNEFDHEREHIYQEGYNAGEKQNDKSELHEEYSLKIDQLHDELEKLNFQNKELSDQLASKPETNFNIKEYLESAVFFQEDNFNILDRKLDFSKLQLTNTDNLQTEISLKQIIDSLELEENKDVLISYKDEQAGKINYSVVFGGNGNAFLVDARFSDYLLENNQLLQDPDEKLKEELAKVFKKRVDFLSDTKLKNKIIETLNELEGVNSIESVYPCLYIPSETLTKELTEIDEDFFNYAKEHDTPIFSPAGLVNVLNHAKYTLLSERNVVRIQILADMVEAELGSTKNDEETAATEDTIDDSDSDDTTPNISEPEEDPATDNVIDEKVSLEESNTEEQTETAEESTETEAVDLGSESAEKNEDDSIGDIESFLGEEETNQSEPEEQVSTEENIAEETSPEAELSTEPENIEYIIAYQEVAEEPKAEALPENDILDDSNEDNASEEDDKSNPLLDYDDENQTNVDKLNIGSFLDGGDLNEEEASKTEIDTSDEELTTEPQTDNIDDIITDTQTKEQAETTDSDNKETADDELDGLGKDFDINIDFDNVESITKQDEPAQTETPDLDSLKQELNPTNTAAEDDPIAEATEEASDGDSNQGETEADDSAETKPAAEQKESKKEKSPPGDINPEDFDIESFLNS